MRIERLDLLAFGPFSGTKLDFGTAPRALQLVYGPNEAGKSTTLRALVALLFGIPERTQDAHLHEMGKLRLAATLRGHDGKRLSIIRRKGRKQTLLDADERPLEEGVLSQLLGGLDENLYRHMFGLDHERLRLGAEALLRGGGGVGEGLFDAGTGARSIHAALSSLREEADALYRPKGQRKLNVALATLRDRQRERKQAMLSPATFEEQEGALAQAEREREQTRKQKSALVMEQARLELGLRVLKPLALREQLLAQRHELGDVAAVSIEAVARAKALDAARGELLAEVSRLRAQCDAAARALEALPRFEHTAVSGELARELTERLGNHRAAERELPRLRGELRNVTRELLSIRKRIGQSAGAVEHLDASRRTRLRKTAEELRLLEAELNRAKLAHDAAKVDHEDLQRRLGALGAPASVEALAAWLKPARHHQLASELVRCDAQLARQASGISHGLAQLGIAHSAAELAKLRLPARGEAEELERAIEALSSRAADIARRRLTCANELSAVKREMDLLEAEGQPVTEDDLAEARQVRERFWSALAADLRAGTPPVADERLRAFEASQRATDRVADRLRQESGRAGLIAQQRVRQQALAHEQQRLDIERREADEQAAALQMRFSDLWRPSGLSDRLPRDVSAARERLEALIALSDEHERTAAERARIVGAQAGWDAALSALLEGVLSSEQALAATSDERIAQAEQSVAREQARALSQRELGAAALKAERELTAQTARLSGLEQRVLSLRQALAPELMALGLDGTLSADEALACLAELVQLEVHARDAERLQQQIGSLEADSASFASEVRELARAHSTIGEDVPLAEVVAVLCDEAQRSRDLARDHARLTQEVGQLSSQLSGSEAKLASYEQSLHELLSSLSVPDLTTLFEVEAKATRAAELQESLARIEAELFGQGGGMSLDGLLAAAREIEPSQARARIEEISVLREALDEQLRDADQHIGRLSAGLTLLRQTSGANESAEEAEAALAHAQQLVRRYVEVRLALSILTREVERYREEHQGPVLTRASVLFPLLTLGRYRGLDVDYADDDTPRLCALREDSVRVHVEGLSDGTRDQLYLSLRIASIERFVERNPPLPIVLDDILVHFDDARSEAALRVLGELASRTQVLFFTHHARIVELAKRVLPASQLQVHTLRDPRSATPLRDDGPLFARG